jgi:uncharacterized protein YbaA (DUF1428 family)
LITEESKEIAYVDSFVVAAPKNHTGKPPWIAHESREGRNRINKNVLADPRLSSDMTSMYSDRGRI